MIDDFKAVFLPIDEKILNLYKGPILDGMPYDGPENNPGIDMEDVPSFLNHCKNYFVKVYLYAYEALDEHQTLKVNRFIASGLISSVFQIDKLSDLKPSLEKERINLLNSLMIITHPEEQNEAFLLGFNESQWDDANLVLWGNAEMDNDILNLSETFSTLKDLNKKLEYYLNGKSSAFLTNDLIIFIEDEYDEFLNQYVQENLTSINERLAEKKMQLLYFPDFKTKMEKVPTEIFSMLRHRLPVLYSLDDAELNEVVHSVFDKLSPIDFYKMLLEELGLPFFRRPCLLRNISNGDKITKNKFTHWLIDYETKSDLDQDFDGYIQQVSIPRHYSEFTYYSLEEPSAFMEYDAEASFNTESTVLSHDLIMKIDEIKEEGNYKVLAEALIYMLQTLKDDQPELLKKVKPLINKGKLFEPKVVLSPIVIDKDLRIFLPDYGNIEVKMHALPKTVYLFFLQYDQGVRFKNLYQYKDELLRIYYLLSNRDNELIKKAIDDLVDMTNPSINQKCSRIREAFRKIMHENTAQHYFIAGANGEPKKIKLARDLIDIRTKDLTFKTAEKDDFDLMYDLFE